MSDDNDCEYCGRTPEQRLDPHDRCQIQNECAKATDEIRRLRAELAEARLNHKLCADQLLAAQAERAAALKDVGGLVEELAEARRHKEQP